MVLRTLGRDGPTVSAIGFGCMSFAGTYASGVDRADAMSLIREAVDAGVTLFDNAEAYGPFTNETLVAVVKRVAERLGAAPSQVAFAWLLAQRPWIVPIPGTSKAKRLHENLRAVDMSLTPDDLAEIDKETASFAVQGERLPEAAMKQTRR